jgi:hypothetical protein
MFVPKEPDLVRSDPNLTIMSGFKRIRIRNTGVKVEFSGNWMSYRFYGDIFKKSSYFWYEKSTATNKCAIS